MHSSRMRTARSSSRSGGLLPGGCLPGEGCLLPRGVSLLGVSLPGGCLLPRGMVSLLGGASFPGGSTCRRASFPGGLPAGGSPYRGVPPFRGGVVSLLGGLLPRGSPCQGGWSPCWGVPPSHGGSPCWGVPPSQGGLPARGCLLPRGVPAWGVSLLGGLPTRGVPPWWETPPRGQNHRRL